MKRFMLPLLLLLLTPQTVVAQRSADHFLGGAVILGETASACNASQKQALRWSSASNTIEMCDGNSTWRQIIAITGSDMPAAPSRDIGYFVLSHNTTTGNIGGIQSADSFCLNELTTYDWRGKANAQSRGLLNSTNVKAWLCSGSSCQNLNAWQIYQFAVANDPDKGGLPSALKMILLPITIRRTGLPIITGGLLLSLQAGRAAVRMWLSHPPHTCPARAGHMMAP